MPIAGYTPPLVAANGKPWNFIIINGDDWHRDTLRAMPKFLLNYAARGTYYPCASVNTPLCFPGRAATYTGWRVERHDAVDNGSGTRYVASGALAYLWASRRRHASQKEQSCALVVWTLVALLLGAAGALWLARQPTTAQPNVSNAYCINISLHSVFTLLRW